MGRGRGAGDRPIEEDQTRAFDTRVKGQATRGKVFAAGRIPGRQVRGESELSEVDALEAGSQALNEAIERQKIPRAYRSHARDYFNKLNEGTSP